jgi:hypothetical protein
MQLLDWPFLDALQTGALAALCVSFGADAFSRRDKMMGWLSLSCLLVSLRHAVLALGSLPAADLDLLNRAQSLLVAFGFIALCAAIAALFPRQVPRRFAFWVAVGMLPNYYRNLVLPSPGIWDTWLHHAANVTYLLGCGFIIHWTLKARQEGDPMGRKLFLGFLGLILPVVVEIAAISFFNRKVRLSGFSLVFLAMGIGTSWQWLVANAMQSRLRLAEIEAEIWRSLIPGIPFRTDLPSQQMEDLFGLHWQDRIRARPDAPLVGSDGTSYRLRSRPLHLRERLGWYERDTEPQTGHHGFLSGWTVGLGMDDAAENARIQSLLRSWGAEVQNWGTVPPREGPFPSVLLWAREPSILSVWREDDLLRRRPRWIQIGGPITEGPHARFEIGVSEAVIQQTLERLLSRR